MFGQRCASVRTDSSVTADPTRDKQMRFGQFIATADTVASAIRVLLRISAFSAVQRSVNGAIPESEIPGQPCKFRLSSFGKLIECNAPSARFGCPAKHKHTRSACTRTTAAMAESVSCPGISGTLQLCIASDRRLAEYAVIADMTSSQTRSRECNVIFCRLVQRRTIATTWLAWMSQPSSGFRRSRTREHTLFRKVGLVSANRIDSQAPSCSTMASWAASKARAKRAKRRLDSSAKPAAYSAWSSASDSALTSRAARRAAGQSIEQLANTQKFKDERT